MHDPTSDRILRVRILERHARRWRQLVDVGARGRAHELLVGSEDHELHAEREAHLDAAARDELVHAVFGEIVERLHRDWVGWTTRCGQLRRRLRTTLDGG